MTNQLAAVLLATACLLSTACGAAIDDPDPVDAGQCHTVSVDRCAAAPTVPYAINHYESCVEPTDGACLANCLECEQ
jgi:hypothetical protein